MNDTATIRYAEFDYNGEQGRALALAMAGITIPAQYKRSASYIAGATGINVVHVVEALRNASFVAYVDSLTAKVQSELLQRGAALKINRIAIAQGLLEAQLQIKESRAALYSTHEQVPDEVLQAMGLDTSHRNLSAATIPGAQTGMIAVETAFVATVTQNGAVVSRMPVLVGKYDKPLADGILATTTYISKELGEFAPDQTVNVNNSIKLYDSATVDTERI